MKSPYGIEVVEACSTCELRREGYFCSLSNLSLSAFEEINHQAVYPKGTVLFLEGQSPRGVWVLCAGRAKLSACSREGKSLILQIAEPGQLLGLSATLSGEPYELTAETLEPSQAAFVKREDFLLYLKENGEACLRAAQHLSNSYHAACEQVRSLGLSNSCAEKLAKLLLDWGTRFGEQTPQGTRVKLGVTHEEIAQMIGTSRETVTRLFGHFKHEQMIRLKGSTLIINDKTALESMFA